MNNYIVLNGIKSTTIKGLLIQSLPPITKPMKRTSIEEIDGRDGDVITEIGYAAYDKEISIGLYGDYDVDEVISYFDSEGQVIFSNEPDKYYNYAIYQQIDFERLIRFRTATVTMHVQPFKYSAVEKSLSQNQLIQVRDTAAEKNEITLASENGIISISGTAKYDTEMYIPLREVNLDAGSYTFIASASGQGADSSRIRLIKNTPADINTFGGTYMTLNGYDNVSISDSFTTESVFNYIYLYIPVGTVTDYILTVRLLNDVFDEAVIYNIGNTMSRPTMIIHGSGTINLNLNGEQIMVIELGDEEHITVDAEELEAYKNGVLKNRLITGNIENLTLKPGKNILTWSGSITELYMERYSRWI